MALLESLSKSPKIVITRYRKTEHATHSIISYLGRDLSFCFENTDKLIPPGLHTAFLFKSPKFHRLVLRLIVKGRLYIEIHPANYSSQLNGCFAPVTTTTLTGGLGSIVACDKLYNALPPSKLYLVEVTEDYQV